MALRRIFIADLRPGRLPLPPESAHHLLDVLRLDEGSPVTAFNAAGQTADAIVRTEGSPALDVGDLVDPPPRRPVTIASAVPKGDRADWLVEKLAELGVARWIPLQTARSVVHPSGREKHARWERIASEAARQSHAPGVLTIDTLQPLADLTAAGKTEEASTDRWFCSTGPDALSPQEAPTPDVVLVGPEGGWTPQEEAALLAAGYKAVSLGATVLRVETACLVAAAFAIDRARTP